MNKERYLQKIKKLLNKAKCNSSSEEAATALRMAQTLMREHGLDEASVEFTDISEALTKGAPDNARKPTRYTAMLLTVIRDAFGVEAILDWRYTARGIPVRIVRFYGPAERPEVAAYAFDVLARQLRKARADFISGLRKNIKPSTKTSRADNYCEGWVNAVWHTVKDFTCTEAEITLMQAYFEKRYGNLNKAGMREAKKVHRSDESRHMGYLDGKNVRLHHGVGGSSDSPALIGRE
ncbi:DUF2786 domain-containing protein [Salmonella enterica subsp. enterica serovar Virchow]|nr:DUF2786 domain-containing protein [Salmonella enterica subsp. enterica serovar Virchow]